MTIATSAIALSKLDAITIYLPRKKKSNTTISEDFTPKKEQIYQLGLTELFKIDWNLESPKNQKSKPYSNKVSATGQIVSAVQMTSQNN